MRRIVEHKMKEFVTMFDLDLSKSIRSTCLATTADYFMLHVNVCSLAIHDYRASFVCSSCLVLPCLCYDCSRLRSKMFNQQSDFLFLFLHPLLMPRQMTIPLVVHMVIMLIMILVSFIILIRFIYQVRLWSS